MLRAAWKLLLLTAMLVGCDEGSDPILEPLDAAASSQVVFHFKMIGDASGLQDFRAATNDARTIAAARQQLRLPEQARDLHINGAIARGNGGHNLEWTWHFILGEWSLAEVSIALCDGNAFIVEQAVDYWVDEIGTFCPWGAYVAAEVGALADVTDQLIVKYLTDLSPGELERATERASDVAAGLGIELSYFRAGALGTHVFKLGREYSVDEVAALAVALEAADPTVEYAEPDRIMQTA